MISPSNGQGSVSPEYVRASQITHIAIGAGALVLLAAVVLTQAYIAPNKDAGRELIDIMSIIHGVLGLQLYTLGWFLFNRHLRAETSWGRSNPGAQGDSPLESFLLRLRTASIIRLSLFEVVAFFGLIVCFLAASDGVLQAEPMYWLNTLSLVVLLAMIAMTFPTRARIVSLANEL